MKITIIGAGNVGAGCAEKLAKSAWATELVFLHTRACIAKGKSLDIIQSSRLYPDLIRLISGVDKEDYSETIDYQIIIITSGARVSPGMSREDMLSANAEIVIPCVEEAIKYSPRENNYRV